MMREPENWTYAYLDAFAEELFRSGLKNIVVCPGSRSTPLAYAFARHGQIKLWMHLDERSAGFFALGMAKASQRPVALLCTSGTAAANFFPAVVEAYQSRVPLLVLTADRPPELRDIGAPQAIDQLRIYGVYTRWFMEMALPEASDEMLRYVRTVAGRALLVAQGDPAGPVHLNFPLREPLVPAPIPGQNLPPVEKRDPIAWYGRPDGQPYVQGFRAGRDTSNFEIGHLVDKLTYHPRGLIICGPATRLDESSQIYISELAAQLDWPILADPLSGMRSQPDKASLVVDNYDAFLRDANLVEQLAPEFILRFSAMPTSKPLLLYLKRYPQVETWVIDGGDGWEDPTALSARMLHVDTVNFCLNAIEATNFYEPANNDWLEQWQTVTERTARAIERLMHASEELSEGRVFAELSQLLPANSILYVGNSMPVRDLDTFFRNTEQPIRIYGNRGANGIDGLVSSALGASTTQTEPTVLVLGDISFYHDLNGLLAAKQHRLNATIIVLNNDGGGIFSFLPQSGYPDNFEELFGTPHGLDFEHAAKLYGANWQRVQNWNEFRAALQNATGSNGLNIIEVPTNRAHNVTQHREIWKAVSEELMAVSR
jgi:2-succinyl-5-enolpyruvyl-6-hydroxy-3-cyclohexene-1-carboxylate synthase